ncbi:unnamed protein product [Rangifer tarandus platyrhynchus]|uniref:Uncharacterized protein n=2 Tax=Rangifer tarandus platyrhynchus TaxID=3082113 RepID=A0AC59Y1C4_RANTA|nr:unnamed protein product [Rangifer tarandus platyrhynchus]
MPSQPAHVGGVGVGWGGARKPREGSQGSRAPGSKTSPGHARVKARGASGTSRPRDRKAQWDAERASERVLVGSSAPPPPLAFSSPTPRPELRAAASRREQRQAPQAGLRLNIAGTQELRKPPLSPVTERKRRATKAGFSTAPLPARSGRGRALSARLLRRGVRPCLSHQPAPLPLNPGPGRKLAARTPFWAVAAQLGHLGIRRRRG